MLKPLYGCQDGDVYGPVELAEYILKTGDQEMVVNFLQHQMDVGKVSNWACVNPKKCEGHPPDTTPGPKRVKELLDYALFPRWYR